MFPDISDLATFVICVFVQHVMPSIGVQAAGDSVSARMGESVTFLQEPVSAQADTLVKNARYGCTSSLFIDLDMVT